MCDRKRSLIRVGTIIHEMLGPLTYTIFSITGQWEEEVAASKERCWRDKRKEGRCSKEEGQGRKEFRGGV